MRKLCCALLAALCLILFTGCDVREMSSLRDVAKPYVGEYQCEKMTLGGDDVLQNYEYVRLKLSYNGKFTLFYRDKNGRKGEYGGEYSFAENSITFTAKNGTEESSKSFPYKKGTVYIELPTDGKLLLAEFST